MKKIVSFILTIMCSVLLTLTACGLFDSRSKPIPAVSVGESGSSGKEPEPPESTASFSTESDGEQPADHSYVGNIHDMSDGNYIYNANVTDISNTERYYGTFSWAEGSGALWTSSLDEKLWTDYDPDAAVKYGLEHWDDEMGLCAAFVSRCLKAGGIIKYTESSTALTLQLLHSRLGFGQFLTYNKSDNTITLPDYARPGDVVQIYCTYEGCMIHTMLMVGTDEDGKMRAVSHNLDNSGQSAYIVDEKSSPCMYCGSDTVEIFFYHFYCDDDEGFPAQVANNRDILIWEQLAYIMKGEKYDRGDALRYADVHHEDGLGYHGALHTSKILGAGGLSAAYPNQSALFFQLLKSAQGRAYSQPIQNDRTVVLPIYAKAGDIGFVYCPEDGIITSSFIISGADENGRMKALSFDMLNNGKSAFRIENECVGCDAELGEVIIFCFND